MDNIKFKKYPSIENAYREKFINDIKLRGFADKPYVVTEKVHGANFSIWYNGEDFRCAKRTGFIEKDEVFYNYETVFEEIKNPIKEIWDIIKNSHEKGAFLDEAPKLITIYGEIFGGSYPHPDVKQNPNATRLQKGVFYHPDNKFYAFDISINGKLMGYNIFNMLCEGRLFISRPLIIDNLENCLKYPNEFQTTIPGRLGLPEIENNICEGVVISPLEPLFLPNGSRVIIKNKNNKFKEKADAKTRNKTKKVKKYTDEYEGSKEGKELYEKLLTYITENRLRNVISKIGKITDKDFGILLKEMRDDIFIDFEKEETKLSDIVNLKEEKYIIKKIGNEISKLIRSNFTNIIDGIF